MSTQFAVFHIDEAFGVFGKEELLEKFTNERACATLRIDLGDVHAPLWPVLQRWRDLDREQFVPIYTMEQLSSRPPTMEELGRKE